MAMHILFPTWSLSLVMLVGCAVPEHNTKEPPAKVVFRPSLFAGRDNPQIRLLA